jgi:hypothetical protein
MTVETNAEGITRLVEQPHPWLHGFTGQIISLLAFVGLMVGTYLLAKWGARMERTESSREV